MRLADALQVDPDDQAPRTDTKHLSVVRFYLCVCEPRVRTRRAGSLMLEFGNPIFDK